MPTSKSPHLLIIDTDKAMYQLLYKAFTDTGFSVAKYTPNISCAIQRISEQRPDMVLLEVELESPKDGLSFGNKLAQEYQLPFVFCSTAKDDYTFYKGLEAGCELFITKNQNKSFAKHCKRSVLTLISKKESTQTQQKGVMGLVDYLDKLKEFGKHCTTKVPIPYEDIAFFTTDSFTNEYNNEEKPRPNYIWFLTKNNEYFFLKTSLNKLLSSLPYYFIRVNESYIVNISPNTLEGRINGSSLNILKHRIYIKDTYSKELKNRITSFYYCS